MDDIWARALVFMAISATVGISMMVGSWVLRVRPKAPPPSRTLTYESGEEPEGPAWVRFHPRYYVVALVFVLFDVEAVFVIPWALNIQELGLFAILEMLVFLGILLLGWYYALKKGALRWQ